MPFIRITVPSNASVESNQALAGYFTTYAVETLRKPGEMTTVAVVRVESSEYFIGGEAVEPGPGAGFRWTLFTADAHGLYEQFGFQTPDSTAMVRPAADRPAPLA